MLVSLWIERLMKASAMEIMLKVACTSGPIFEKFMKRYPIYSLQIINY